MSNVTTIRDEARGPLTGIADESARKEIGKLWTNIEGRWPANGKSAQPHTLVTHADLTRAEASLSAQIAAVKAQASSGSSSGASEPISLLGRDNIWTGRNTYTREVTVRRLDAGQLLTAYPTIMLPTNVTYTLDVQRTTNVQTGATGVGGAAALLVNHRAEGGQPQGSSVLVSGIRCQMETRHGGAANTVNDVVSGYFGLLNAGQNTNGFGVHVDAYHRADGNFPNTYGVSVEMFGSVYSQTGKLVGCMVRAAGNAAFLVDQGYTRPTDYGFLATPDAAGDRRTIQTAFSAGSDWIGPLKCSVAFDAGHAVASVAALRVRAGDKIVMDGPSPNACFIRYSGTIGGLQLSGGGPSVFVKPNGDLWIDSGTLHIYAPRDMGPLLNLGGGSYPSFRHWGYFEVKLGGLRRWVPFFDGALPQEQTSQAVNQAPAVADPPTSKT